MAVWVCDIKVFVCQVKASGEADVIIDNCYFAMVPVIHEYIEQRNQRIKNSALDSLAVQTPHKFRLYKAYASEIIIDKTHLHAFRNLFHKDFFNSVEDFRIFHGKIFHENKFPCIFQILQHGFQGWLCLRIVDYIRIPVYRIAAGVLNIIFLVMDINIFFF